ncbi:MAG: hypothetical protein AAF579_03580 [Cyanobacteria bacterium P01_C01_bin.118]
MQQVTQTFNSHPPHVIETQTSMCQASQFESPQPIARWILEEGQLLGVLVASFSDSALRKISTCR